MAWRRVGSEEGAGVVADGADRGYAWLLGAVGVVVAGAFAATVCRAVRGPVGLGSLLVRAAAYVGGCVAAGTVGAWGIWRLMPVKPGFRMVGLLRGVGGGLAFLPCVVLLYWRDTPWMAVVAGCAAGVSVLAVREMFGEEVVGVVARAEGMASLYGLPRGDARVLRAVWIVLCVQAALVFAVLGELAWSGVALGIGVSVLLWWWWPLRGWWRWGPGRDGILAGVAIGLTALALWPWARGGGGGGLKGAVKAGVVRQRPDVGFESVLLLPPPEKRAEWAAPEVRRAGLGLGLGKSVVIPFDGSYWYFRAPSRNPGPRAHVARGRPTDLNVHSADGYPLVMQAHQVLAEPIDLGCCSAVEVAITNADNGPGTIWLGMVFGDSRGRGSLTLGVREIVSSGRGRVGLNRPAVEETVAFPVTEASGRRFDEITVLFVAAPERAREGAKVAIRSFTLVPR